MTVRLNGDQSESFLHGQCKDMLCLKLHVHSRKAFKAGFKVLFKFCNDLKADYKLTIGEKEKSLIFFNAFSAMFVQQKKQYHKVTMDEFMEFFQVCHSADQPICKQQTCKATQKSKHNEADQMKDAANKKCAAACRKISLSNNNDNFSKNA